MFGLICCVCALALVMLTLPGVQRGEALYVLAALFFGWCAALFFIGGIVHIKTTVKKKVK